MVFKVLVEEEEEVFTEEEVEEITPRRVPSQRKVAMVKYSVLNSFFSPLQSKAIFTCELYIFNLANSVFSLYSIQRV